MVYIEDAVRKSFRIPKWSVLVAPLKFKILTRGCCVISVRWKLWPFCTQFSVVHSWQRNWKVHTKSFLLQYIHCRINFLIIICDNTVELFSSRCILFKVMDQRSWNSQYKQCIKGLWITRIAKLYVHIILEVSLNRSYVFRRQCFFVLPLNLGNKIHEMIAKWQL